MNPKFKRILSKTAKIVMRTIGVLVFLIVVLPFTLYIPWVQNIVKDYACEKASEETGLNITIDRILLKFPLDLSVDNMLVLDQQRDTMLHAGNLTAGVEVLPLFSLDVKVDKAQLTDATYRSVSEDSSMYVRARVNQCVIKGIDMDLDNSALNIVEGTLRGGDIKMDMFPYKAVTECDTTKSKPWKIRAYHLNIEDVNYTMSMLPTIDNLGAYIAKASLTDGVIDTERHTVDARSFVMDSAQVSYVYPTARFAADYAARHPIPIDTICNPADTIPWTINADTVKLTGGHVVYALKGAVQRPGKGLDANFMELSKLDLEIHKLYNRADDIRLGLNNLAFTEHGSGLDVNSGSGDIAMSGNIVNIKNMHVGTLLSDINVDAYVDLSIADNPDKGMIQMSTNSKIALQDITKLMPQYKEMLKDIPQIEPLTLKGHLSGNASRVDLGDFTANLPRYARATVTGSLYNPTDFNRMKGDLEIDARFDNINFVKPTLLDKASRDKVDFPPMSLTAKTHIDRGNIVADAVMKLATGTMVGKGSFNGNTQEYFLDATFDNFPVKAIAPLADADNLTAHMKFRGKGYDFFGPNANVEAEVDLAGVNYNNSFYKNFNTRLSMSGGKIDAHITSDNDNCRVNMDVVGTVSGRHYQLDAVGYINELDLNALHVYKGECRGKGRLVGYFDIDLDNNAYDASFSVEDLEWYLDGDLLKAAVAQATFKSDAMYTELSFDNEDNHFRFSSPSSLDMLTKQFSKSGDIAIDQIDRKAVNIDTLQAAMPAFTLGMKMGTDGLVQRYMQKYGVDFREVSLDMRNDSTIFIDGYVHALSLDGTNIDTLTLKATQWNRYLAFNAHMGNRPGTMDEFAQVTVVGGIRGATIDFLGTQHNIHNEMGYRLGCNATLTDTALNMKLFPKEPVIGYRKWLVNEDNYLNVNYETNMLDANLKLWSDSSSIALNTVREPGATHENILLNIANLRIEEWTKFMPNIDPMSGVLSANVDVDFDGHNLEGKGIIDLKKFIYNGIPEGDFTLNTHYGLDPATGGTRVTANMLVDNSEVALAVGSIGNGKDGEAPLRLQMKLDRFPLSKASAFVPGRMLWMRGYLNGDIQLSGSADNPRINGYIMGDSAYVTLPRYGCSLKLCDDKLVVDDNALKFNNYRIMGYNDNAIGVNGVVDMRDMDNMTIDLSLNGKNVQFINAEQRTFSEVFGKAYADVAATVKSNSSYMSVKADLKVLPTTNITYVMKDEISNLTTSVDENMVTFVNFNDSVGGTPTLMTAAATTATNILANIEIQQGAKINAFLSPDGKDRASINGSGLLKYSLDFAGKDVLTGTYTIESGEVRYSPPLISQKNFKVTSGSSVTWTGDMLNPQLNLSATEHVKTSVSSDDQGSRLVDFLITANVGGTLGVIKLDFDLGAEGDMGVTNELQSMTDVQRSQAALNMLLYNTYSGTNSAGSVNNLTASAALFSFLQSQLNTWAAKTLKGVDLSFGINQYEGKSGKGTETSYSYRLSKNLFNDRFKIVVGGEYSTDASAEENFAQNLLSDISFEYSLNDTGTKYVRLFRHAGYESILEGQVTETGVGFVMKRKAASLKSLFGGNKPLKVVIKDTIPAARKDDEETESLSNQEKTKQ